MAHKGFWTDWDNDPTFLGGLRKFVEYWQRHIPNEETVKQFLKSDVDILIMEWEAALANNDITIQEA